MFGIYITLLSAKVRFMSFRGLIENFFVVVLHRAKKDMQYKELFD